MAKGKRKATQVARVGRFSITTDGTQYIVDIMGLPDVNNHFFEGDPTVEIVKEQLFYTSFEGLAHGVLEKAVKHKFQESGLKGVYTNTLRDLISQCDGLLEKDK